MKNKKLFLVAAASLLAVGVFAGELPENAIDWPEKLGMTPKMLLLVIQIGIIIFAAKLGGMLEAGRLPDDIAWLGKIVKDISFANANRYFFGGKIK